jgi:hypothetical protein
MGTRNLTMLIAGGKTRVAQYGQWDGGPGSTGKELIDFLREADLEALRQKALALSFSETNWDGEGEPPHSVSRDTGWQILRILLEGRVEVHRGLEQGRVDEPATIEWLMDYSHFGGDGLFCEWAYVVDLDRMVLEVHMGGGPPPAPAGGRFAAYEDPEEKKYGAVRLALELPLADLPEGKDLEKLVEASPVYREIENRDRQEA